MVGPRRLYQESERDGSGAVPDQLLHTPLSPRVPYQAVFILHGAWPFQFSRLMAFPDD